MHNVESYLGKTIWYCENSFQMINSNDNHTQRIRLKYSSVTDIF